MRLSNFREAPLLRASLLINQEKSKKGFKAIQPEINKMSEIFGSDFDRNLHKSLFDEIDFREVKTLLNSKSSKTLYFIQEFPQLLERGDFISLFSEILMSTENSGTTQEIFDGLNKITKLSYENQFKIIISFIYSGNEKFVSDAKTILINKCNEIQKEAKIDQLSEGTIQTLIMILGTFDDKEKESIEIVNFIEATSIQQGDDIKQISDIEKMLDTGMEDPIEIEKIFFEIGPMMINNMITSPNCEMLNYDLDEKRLASFILFLIKHQNWVEDKENKYLNKIFLKSLDNEAFNLIDDVSDKKTINWNLDNFYKMFKKSIEAMDPNQVINAFDDPKFSIKDKKNFDFFINTLQKMKILTNPSQFFNFIFTKWNNEINQIEFLNFFINHQQNETYSFKNYNGKKVKRNFELTNLISLSKSQHLVEAWSCIDLYEVLFKLSKGNYYKKVKELFDWPIQNIPEIIVLALTSIKPEKDEFLFHELIQETLPNFLTNHASSFTMIEEVWNSNKDLIIKTLCNMYEASPDLMNLSRILDITQKLKDSLLILVNCNDYVFSVNLGILAVKRDFLHMEQWLKDRINKSGDDFIEALLNYIKINLIAHCKGNSTNKENVLEKAQLSLESLAIILENLIGTSSNSKISQRIKNEITEVYKIIFEIFDEIQVQPVNSAEIEATANNIFKSMFNGEISVEELIEKLKQYKQSNIPKESEIYACMIHSVLDEYRFYHLYPEKELVLESTLFGQIINNKLLEGVIETIALKYILEGIKKGSGPMYTFGTLALSQFIDKIQQWPTYLSSLIETKQIKSNPALYDKLIKRYNESVNNGKDVFSDDRKDSSYASPDTEDFKDDRFNSSGSGHYNETKTEKTKTKLMKPPTTNGIGNISLMLGVDNNEGIQPPAQDVIDNMKFIFNSMGKNNVSEKSKELKALLVNENIIRWFSNFFIINRISAENNNHQIYNELITLINNKDLNKLLIKDTIFFIKKLLASENLEKELKEKNVLKNLGSWLGIMTLSKNKPILAKDLDLKEIIFEAYEKGKLSAITNFVARIIEHSAKTKVFHPKNPWIQAILLLFSEIHSKQNLKQNLKFEIDNLFKKLDLDISTFPPGKLLDNFKVCANSPDFTKPHNLSVDTPIEHINLKELFSKIMTLDNYLTNILSILNASSNQKALTKQELATILTRALETPIKDVINYVLEKNLNYPLVTAREIIVKDFMFDRDETKFKTAAAFLVKSLAGSYTMVTSNEILKTKVNDKLKDKLASMKYDAETIENILNYQNSEFFDIGFSYIHNFVIKKVIEKIQKDPTMAEEIDKRKMNKSNEEAKKDFLKKIQVLPDELKPNKDGLSEDQFKIYEDFDKIYETYNKYEQSSKSTFLNKVLRMLKEIIDSYHANSPKIVKNYEVCMVNIKNISHEAKTSFDDEEQLACLEKTLVDSQISDVQIATEFAVLSLKYSVNASKANNSLLLNVYSHLIKSWVKLHPDISKDITERLLGCEDIFIRFKPDLHYCFLKKQIFSIPDYEKYFCEFLDNDSTCMVASNLLQNLAQKKVISPSQFKKIPAYMFDSRSEDYFSLFGKHSKISTIFDKVRTPVINYKICKIKDQNTYKKFTDKCLFDFKRIVDNMYPFEHFEVEKLRAETKDIMEPNFIYKDEGMTAFTMIIAELCIKGSFDDTKKKPIHLLYPENEAKCLYGLLYGINSNNSLNKLKLFLNILNGIFFTLHHDYIKNGINFNQRPYYKLLYNLLALLDGFNNTDNILDSEFKKINYLMYFAGILYELSPMNYPGFALAWLDLISCKHFVTNFLEYDNDPKETENIRKFEKYLNLMVTVFSYLKSFTNEVISDFNQKIFLDHVYKFIFLLCNSFPDIISGYYFLIILILPPGSIFIQMKNLILSCCPRNVIYQDPFGVDLKNNSITNNANVLFETDLFFDNEFKKSLNNYIKIKNDALIEEIVKKLNNGKIDKDKKFYFIDQITIYWSQILLQKLIEKKINPSYGYEFFVKLMKLVEKEDRDHLINSILNELRYPSIQTIFFANLIIFIFETVGDETIEEHILKNLVERLLYKPFPWGIALTFINLMKNEKELLAQKTYITKNAFEDVLTKLLAICKENNMVNYLSN